MWEARADTLADEEEVKWEVEINDTVLMSESVDANIIRISKSWCEFLILLVVQHSHIVSEHIVNEVGVLWINGLINVVLVVSVIHGIPTEIVLIEIVGFNEHIVKRTNINVWANQAGLHVKHTLDAG